MRSFLSCAAFTLVLATSTSAQRGYTQEELLALPRVCLAQRFISKELHTPVVSEAERKQWEERLGPAYEAFHHFCWGLMDMRRAGTVDHSQRKSQYARAIANFEYVQRNADASFPMLPEVLLRKGMALRLSGNDSAAATEFATAIRAKSDYTPAYAALVDLYVDLHDLDGAQEILKRGLREAPQSKILQNKKTELETLMK